MSTVDVFEAVAGSGIRDTHFFNGRLLTAGDLRTTQDAVIARDRQLAHAMGSGVAHGLAVTLGDAGTTGSGARPKLHVTPGLAVSRRGDTLELRDAIDLALIREADARLAAAGEFAICPPPRPVTTLANFGLYVLTIAPASWKEGLAPMSELRSDGVGSACGRRYELDGVQFGLTRVDLTSEPGDATADPSAEAAGALRGEVAELALDLDTRLGQLMSGLPIAGLAGEVERKLSRLRSSVAHLCLGTEERRALVVDPLGSASQGETGALERLFRQGTLRESEVPLALLYWSVRGVEFADVWSVRRPLAPMSRGRWGAHASSRHGAGGMASWLQFQQQIEDLGARGRVSLQDLRAVDWFRYLPPVGVMRLRDDGSAPGIDVGRFFETRLKSDPVYMEGARLAALIIAAREYPPIDVEGDELIRLYRVQENMRRYASGPLSRPRPCIVFTNGYAPDCGDAEFDLAHWSYASYA